MPSYIPLYSEHATFAPYERNQSFTFCAEASDVDVCLPEKSPVCCTFLLRLQIELCPEGAQTCAKPLFRCCDFAINPMAYKL